MSTDFLTGMAHASRERAARARALCPEAMVREAARKAAAAPPLQLSALGFDLIAEVKLRSPAAGALQSGAADVAARAADYAAAGAAAISVLTEPTRFDGDLSHLEQAVRSLGATVPAMRKDFLVEPYQVYEARAAGAGGVLLILRMLPRAAIAALLEAAADCGMFALLESFDEADLALASSLVGEFGTRLQLLAGVNSRDLATLQVVARRLETLAPLLPDGVPGVAESGVESAADVARVAAAGYGLALVGSALMRAPDRTGLARTLLAAGRQGRRCG